MIIIFKIILATFLFMGSGSDEITISFTGDVHPVYLMDASARDMKAMKTIFSDSDFIFCNLESPVTDNTRPTAGKSASSIKAKRDYLLRSPASSAPYLKDARFNVVSLANNHTMDYGEQGLMDTIALLDRHGIAYCGAGKNISRASAPVISEKKGVKVAFIARSEIVPLMSSAGSSYPGIAGIGYPPSTADLKDITGAIEQAKKAGAAIIVISLHWGKEGSKAFEPYQREFAEKLLDAGAHCVIGHHPHVLRNIETYKGKTIAYSLGNFIFGSADRPTKVLKIKFIKNGPDSWTQSLTEKKLRITDCIPRP